MGKFWKESVEINYVYWNEILKKILLDIYILDFVLYKFYVKLILCIVVKMNILNVNVFYIVMVLMIVIFNGGLLVNGSNICFFLECKINVDGERILGFFISD